jgi:hypothetical protein
VARPERNARHDDRYPTIDAYFSPEVYRPGVGYSNRNDLDPTGYSISDLQLSGRVGDERLDAEVLAPLGGDLLGRVALSSYGNEEGPRPGGALVDLAEYQAKYHALAGLRGYPDFGLEGDPGSPARVAGGLPGAASIRSRLGIPWGEDDTCYDGPGRPMRRRPEGTRLFLTEQHAMARAPLEQTQVRGVGTTPSGSAAMNAPSVDGWVPEHVLARIAGYANAGIYDGGEGVGFGDYRSGREDRATDFTGEGYPRVTSQVYGRDGEDGRGFVGGGDYGDVSPSEELANIRRENDSGDEYDGSGWSRVPSSYARRRSRVTDSNFDR